MAEQDLSAKEVYERLDVSRTTFGRWTRQESQPCLEESVLMCKVFGFESLDKLFHPGFMDLVEFPEKEK